MSSPVELSRPFDSNGCRDHLDGRLDVVRLQRQGAQEVECFRMLGVGFENLAIDLFGLAELPSLMVLQGDL